MVPVKQTPSGQLLLRDVADVSEGTQPGEYDRLNLRRFISLTANIEGSDLGRVATDIERALDRAGQPPRGVRVDVRGQVEPMRQMFRGLAVGLALSVVAIFLLLTAYFQSPRLALVAVAAVPAVLAGVAVCPWLTDTTLNIQSFMGAIMAIGVAVANAILLVTFAERHRRGEAGPGAAAAAVEGARHRAPADPDDELRHARRHGADGAGPGRGRRADGPARPGRHRRAGRGHAGDAVRPAGGVRGGPGPEPGRVRVARPEGPRELYFHPESGEPMDRAGSDRPTATTT